MELIERQFRSIHEASHAVTALALGGTVHSMTEMLTVTTNASDWDDAIVLVAGNMGVLHQWGKLPNPTGGEDDYVQARAILDGTGVAIAEAEAIAKDILANAWPQVESIANALLTQVEKTK